jgi:tripartite-type tricarboxylate transporter receptor subunit TctC
MKRIGKPALVGLAVIACGVYAGATRAQPYPSRTVRIIVPFTPGGTTDVVARSVAAMLGRSLNQSVVVENRPGAGGSIGADLVAKAPPDGYTLLMGSSATLAFNPSLYPALPYDPVRDFAPVGMVCDSALVLVTNPASELSSVANLIKLAKSNPGKFTYATAGVGSATHVAAELLTSLTGIQTLHVAYKGAGPATVAIAAGEASYAFTGQTLAWPLVAGGKLRAVGLASDHRNPDHPDVPTVAEAGVPNFEATDWFAVVAPAGTPAVIVNKLNAELQALLKDADLKSNLAKQGIEIRAGSPEQLGAHIKSQIAKWAQVIRNANIKGE